MLDGEGFRRGLGCCEDFFFFFFLKSVNVHDAHCCPDACLVHITVLILKFERLDRLDDMVCLFSVPS